MLVSGTTAIEWAPKAIATGDRPQAADLTREELEQAYSKVQAQLLEIRRKEEQRRAAHPLPPPGTRIGPASGYLHP